MVNGNLENKIPEKGSAISRGGAQIAEFLAGFLQQKASRSSDFCKSEVGVHSILGKNTPT
jgi:hypothetical protein